jgi:hypothetical protein
VHFIAEPREAEHLSRAIGADENWQ